MGNCSNPNGGLLEVIFGLPGSVDVGPHLEGAAVKVLRGDEDVTQQIRSFLGKKIRNKQVIMWFSRLLVVFKIVRFF